ncbi:MAG TPA: hypothetical protein P5528_00490 [Steroidobacteraceae bacterium]|nr:hypothetical protein [Steroidobacteraceae bacterium]HRX87895.1 hypothetical protein [Steroidobacteraceae bacterium]
MVIEPRLVEPGAIRRWTRQAFGLLRRGFSVWAAITALLCLWMFLGQRIPILDATLALSAFFGGVIVAARLDQNSEAGFGDVLLALRERWRPIIGFAMVIACAGALIWMLLLARPGVPWWTPFYSDRHVVEVLSTDLYLASRQVFVFAAYALGLSYFGLNIPGVTSFFQFPLTALLGVSWRDAQRLSAAGQVRNLAVMLGVGLLFILLPVIIVLLLPPLVPVLYCFLAAMCYVAFRDIFLGIPENQVAVAAAQRPVGAVS